MHAHPASRPLALTTLGVVLPGIVLPFAPVNASLGFTPLPGLYFLFLVAMTLTYLGPIEMGKHILVRRHSL